MESNQQNQIYKNTEIESLIESSYEKIQENETKTFEFITEKTQVIEKPDFNGNMTKKVQFIVINQADQTRKEKKLELSRVHVKAIYEELKKGFRVLQLTRVGQGKQTRYGVKPIA